METQNIKRMAEFDGMKQIGINRLKPKTPIQHRKLVINGAEKGFKMFIQFIKLCIPLMWTISGLFCKHFTILSKYERRICDSLSN
jgi:hypothetical protein